MKARVYDHLGVLYELDIALDIALGDHHINYKPRFMDGEYLNIFTTYHRVPDVWRYTVYSGDGVPTLRNLERSDTLLASNYADRLAAGAIGTRVIQIVLESPHTSEYTDDLMPKGPAQGTRVGDAGGAIENYLPLVLKKVGLSAGCFSLLVTNPIPYMCSLGCFLPRLIRPVRDSVWEEIWKIPSFPRNFVARTAMYQPEYVVNCCTTKLQPKVTQSLIDARFNTQLFEAPHPAVRWNIDKANVRVVKVC